MGIPRFTINLFKKYKNVHFSKPSFVFNHLFMDYNAFIHNNIKKFYKSTTYQTFEKLTSVKREQAISDFIVKKTIDFVNELKPDTSLYIAFDGPVPRSKMKLQRIRRYKSVKQELYEKELQKIYNIEDNVSKLFSNVSISPGTSFMQKLSSDLKNASKKKKFMNGSISVIIDDTNIPGEGEHKIITFIKKNTNKTDKICFYSPDADCIVLSLQCDNDIYILQEKDNKKHVELYPSDDVKNIFFSILSYKEILYSEFGNKNVKNMNKIYDYILLTFILGSDFVKPIPFMKSNNSRSLPSITNIYNRVYEKRKNSNLVIKNENKYTINRDFLVDLFQELSNMEDNSMKIIYNKLLSEKAKEPGEYKENITYEDRVNAYIYGLYYLPYSTDKDTRLLIDNNPFYNPRLVKVIDYNEPKEIWKQQYYEYFFHLSYDNKSEYDNYINIVCEEYVKSLVFSLGYYLNGDPPSWDWFYPFSVAPLPSDILSYIKKTSDIDFIFEKGKPYNPIEQLAMIIPPQNASILPKALSSIILDSNSTLYPFYPIDVEVDMLTNNKFESSYVKIPHFIDEIVRPVIQDTFKKFTKTEKERNKLEREYFIYESNKN